MRIQSLPSRRTTTACCVMLSFSLPHSATLLMLMPSCRLFAQTKLPRESFFKTIVDNEISIEQTRKQWICATSPPRPPTRRSTVAGVIANHLWEKDAFVHLYGFIDWLIVHKRLVITMSNKSSHICAVICGPLTCAQSACVHMHPVEKLDKHASLMLSAMPQHWMLQFGKKWLEDHWHSLERLDTSNGG